MAEPGNNQVYGVGAPTVLTFTRSIPENARPAVQRRLFVRGTPGPGGHLEVALRQGGALPSAS
jgi:hypothetical protein